MNQDMFDTQEKIDEAIAQFTQLISQPGWTLFCKVVDANIDVLKNHILRNPEKLDEKELNVMRTKLIEYENIRNTPQMIIERFKKVDDGEEDDEVFDTEDTLPKRPSDENVS